MVTILWFNFNACNLVKFTAKAELASLSLNASISQVVDQFVLLHPVQPDKVLLAPMYQGKRYLLQLFCDFKMFSTSFWLGLSRCSQSILGEILLVTRQCGLLARCWLLCYFCSWCLHQIGLNRREVSGKSK